MSFSDMTNCECLPLTEVLSFIVDNRGKTVPTAETGIPLIATNCIKNNELYPVFEKVRYLSEETYQNWFRAHPIPGDIIFVNKGAPGRVCLVPNPVGFCIAQDMMAFRVNDEIINNKYLFAVLRSSQFQTQIEQFHVGTLIPHFKKGDLDKLLIPIPSMDVQKFVGETYYSLCLKIEINNRINKTLEEMAQAIFKSWFVDFEPFQDGEFEDSELGRIPKGWRVGELKEIANFQNGYAFYKVGYSDMGAMVIDLGNVNLFGNFIKTKADKFIPYELYNQNKMEKFHVRKNDLVMIMTDRKATMDLLGKVAKISTDECYILNQRVGRIRVNEGINVNFVYTYLNSEFLLNELKKKALGSVQKYVNTSDITDLKLIIPDNGVMCEFGEMIDPFFSRMEFLNRENEVLNDIRDTLLPKLMSGEIRVPIEEVQ